jgi:von Willebrand factor type A domain
VPEGTHAAGPRGPLRGLALVTILGVVAAAAGAGVWWRGHGSDGPAAAACSGGTIRLVAAPAVADVAEQAAAAVSDDCLTIEVEPREGAKVAADVSDGGDLPELWITDAPWALAGLGDAGVESDEVSTAVASTPVVLVGGPATEAAPSWGDALASGAVALPDPATDPVGTLALAAPRAEEKQVGRSEAETKQMLVPVAQGYAALRADDATADVSLDTLTAGTTRVVAASEQTYLAARGGNDLIRTVTPDTGAPLLELPLVTSAQASPVVVAAADDLAAWFASGDGEAALGDAGLRRGDGSVIKRRGAAKVELLPNPPAEEVLAELRTWQVLSVPSSVLGVFDVSGSMDFLVGAQTRAQLAAAVVSAALDVFPDSARIGLWAFSVDLGGPDQDWRVMEPVRRLDDDVDGTTQRELLQARAAELPDITTGGTGLYDTTLAAYRQALEDYDPAYSNSVILLTDGANDDPGSITRRQLLNELEQLRDPQRPVRVIGLAISEDADFASLRRITRATGGEAFQAKDPQDIQQVFNEAISSR